MKSVEPPCVSILSFRHILSGMRHATRSVSFLTCSSCVDQATFFPCSARKGMMEEDSFLEPAAQVSGGQSWKRLFVGITSLLSVGLVSLGASTAWKHTSQDGDSWAEQAEILSKMALYQMLYLNVQDAFYLKIEASTRVFACVACVGESSICSH